MAKRIVWTKSARLSRKEILTFWIERTKSKKYSKRLATEFNERIDHLKKHPDIGKVTNLENIRTTACGHFSIFYLNEPKEIVIIGIYDTRQNPEIIIKKIKNHR